MDPKRGGSDGGMILAPGAPGHASSFAFPSADRKPSFPPVDEHLVKPEVSREEIIRGRKIITMGANPEHAEAHARVDFVIGPHVRPGAVAASDLLTRVNQGSNFATDVCVRNAGTDPRTGTRYLEELSFEVVNEQSMRDAKEKAEDLTGRGVRRVFAIFVKKNYIGEWSQARREFVMLPNDGMIEDPMFIRPIAVQALLDAAVAESQVVLALWKKGNPELKRIHQQGVDDGQKQGQKRLLLTLLQKRFGSLPVAVEARVNAADSAQVDAWAEKLLSASSLDEVFANELG